MEATVCWIIIFGLAELIHGKLLHRSVGAIVGQPIDDGETWAAIRAIDEWIMVATIMRIEEFAHARFTWSEIGRNERGLTCLRII